MHRKKTAKLTVKAYLDMCLNRLKSLSETLENVHPRDYDRDGIKRTLERYENICGD